LNKRWLPPAPYRGPQDIVSHTLYSREKIRLIPAARDFFSGKPPRF
jgi:hypothetical protein